nr:hypothetical protein [Tanacetum cinerariifolium]
CYLRNVVIEIAVLNIISDALSITTNGQTITGKEYSNPFMAGVNTPRSDEDRLKLMELMVFLLQKDKSDAAEGFEQIIDFLSGSYIHYALTVNPHIYISCIKQFWNTASVKRSGDVTRRVENLENDKADQNLEIIKLKARVKKLEMANKVKSSKLRHLRKVGASRRIESSDDMEDVFNPGRMINDMDKDERIE